MKIYVGFTVAGDRSGVTEPNMHAAPSSGFGGSVRYSPGPTELQVCSSTRTTHRCWCISGAPTRDAAPDTGPLAGASPGISL